MLSLGPDTSITSLTFMPPTPKTSPATVVQAPGPSPGRLNFSLQQLESESQKIRLEIRAKEQEDKATPKTYDRHLKSYETWWDAAELAKVLQNNKLVALPAMPIIASKVAMFLQYETTRKKVSYLAHCGLELSAFTLSCRKSAAERMKQLLGHLLENPKSHKSSRRWSRTGSTRNISIRNVLMHSFLSETTPVFANSNQPQSTMSRSVRRRHKLRRQRGAH
jgi:hypothetical protein